MLAFVVALVAIVLAARAFGRSSDLAGRLDRIESELRALRRRMPAAEEEVPRAAEVPVQPTAPPRPAPPPRAAVAPPPPPRPRIPEAPPPRAAAPSPPPPARPTIDWERWLGVRTTAIIAGIAIALASLLFFKYAIERQWITITMRVVAGTIVGVGCIAASERLLRRDYASTADPLAGAGVATLYASFWAARAYDLVGTEVAFALLVLVTVTCCVLSWRNSSLAIALLGLVGGFATPLMIASHTDRPIGLFGYILLLDGGLLYLAERRRWPQLGLLGLLGTTLYQALWITTRMHAQSGLGLAILGVFALLFALAGRRTEDEDRETWLAARAGGALLPFAFGVYFASRADLGPSLLPLATLLFLLSCAAGWLARVHRQAWLGAAAAAGSVAVVTVWLAERSFAPVWPVVAAAVALSLPFRFFVEWEPERSGPEGPGQAAEVSTLGFFGVLVLGAVATADPTPWPWLVGWLALTALLVRQAGFPGRSSLHVLAAVALGAGLDTQYLVHVRSPGFPSLDLWLGVALALAAASQVVPLLRRDPAARRHAEYAAVTFALLLFVPFANTPTIAHLSTARFLGGSILLGVLVTLAATRLGDGRATFAAVAATALIHAAWTLVATIAPNRAWLLAYPHPAGDVATGFVFQLAAVVVFTAWPFVAGARLRNAPWAWYGAALAAPFWFLSLRRLWDVRFGEGAIGLLPLLLGAVSLAAALRARTCWPADAPQRKSALVWFAAIALGFASVAVPLQLEKQWITIGWALEGLAVAVLWRRLDHPGLKWFGLALLAAATLRLTANQWVLLYHPRPAWRIVNWITYAYLVPAAALVGVYNVLGRDEVARARDWERDLYRNGWPVGALACGLGAIGVVFVWINLMIADWYSTGTVLRVTFERLPARDLTTSIAWAAYALLLLALGMARRSVGLRWVSLGLVLVTIAKVFLYDLGELHDLYRVASLLGLALSLILISLAYQRFVFRKPEVSSP